MDEKAEVKLQADLRRFKALVTKYEGNETIVDRIVETVERSVEALPPIQAPKLYVPEGSHYPETAVLVISDVHVGKKTATYNPKVFVKRLHKLQEGLMSIITGLRTIRPIKKIVVVFCGDVVDAESVYPGQAVDFISHPVLDQIFTLALPAFTEFLLFLLANFEEVEVQAVRGNHGRQNAAKWTSSKSTNWDLVFHKALEVATRGQDRLTWNICDKDWKTIFRVEGQGFLATHGDMILRYYSLPHYGMTRQAERWQNAYRDKIRLTHFIYGHFHSAIAGMRFNQLNIFVNGSFVTDDPYAEEHIGVASIPEQILFGVHPKKGISWRYVLSL
jgi:predicted phosphodiesterase